VRVLHRKAAGTFPAATFWCARRTPRALFCVTPHISLRLFAAFFNEIRFVRGISRFSILGALIAMPFL
jgi:hypothetical protein